MDALIIILTGSIIAVSCGLLGSFLILRKMAMVSDAISHAVLPGIVIAFLLSGDANPVWMLLGAGLLGVITTFLIEFFHQKGGIQTDASIGVTFTWLFALGVIMLSYYAGNAHIDQDCVLYGEIAYVPLDTIILPNGVNLGPKALLVMSVILLLILAFIYLNYKELTITTFDPSFSNAVGISSQVWHYLIMCLVSLTTVASFESVGAILVVALLIVPPATAYLISTHLKKMLILSALFGISVSVLGYYLAAAIDGSIAGAMATIAGFQFAIVFGIQRIQQKRRIKSIIAEEKPGYV